MGTRVSTIRLSRSERFTQGENSISNWGKVIDYIALSESARLVHKIVFILLLY